MKKEVLFSICLAGCLFCGCQALEKKQQAGAAVELNGHYLYRSTLDSLTLGLSSEDSARVAEQYIRQWAQDVLLYDNALARTSDEIEEMVAEYRRTLYAQAYEKRMAERRMDKEVDDSTVIAVYEQMPDRFILSESIMQGLLVIVPNDAPNIAKLRQWMTKIQKEGLEESGEILDEIEKYVYQNASGYELFADRWKNTSEMITHMPIERAELEHKLKTKNQIEVSDTVKTFLLQITAKRMRGEAMPVEYAREQIEKMVLNNRRTGFLQSERERLYNEAIETKKINFFD